MNNHKLPPWFLKMDQRRLAIIVTLLMFLPLLRPGCTSRMEDHTLAAGVALSTAFIKQPEIVIAAIDERAMDETGTLPWPRAAMARAIDRLGLMDAAAIVVDAGLVRGPAAAEARSQRARDDVDSIVAGYEFYTSLAQLPSGYELLTGEGKALPISGELALPQAPADDSPMLAMAGFNFETLMPAGMRVSRNGFSNIFPDEDGVVRSQPLAVRLKHRAYPYLAVASAAAARNFTPLISEGPAGKPDGIKLGDARVNTASDLGIAISFRGRSGSFPTASISDIVSDRLPAETVMGKIVLIGATDPRQARIYSTPLGDMSAIEITANTLDTILRNAPVTPLTGRTWLMALLAAAGIIFTAGAVRLPAMRRAAYALAAIGVIWIAAMALYVFAGVLIPAVHLTIAIALLLVTTLAWRIAAVEIPRRMRTRAFHMRLPHGVIESAFADPAAFDRRGRTRELSAVAIDIRGFASIAHPLSPEVLCSFMRAYRTLVTNVLLKHGAFIESWTGDECRAIFGAPLAQKDHDLISCRAAFAAMRAMSSAQAEIERRYKVSKTRLAVGVASGSAAAGELGPRGAENFGIIGGTVEAAVMLRSFNRTYRTSILVDDSTRSAAEGTFSFRPLDPVMLPGEEKPAVIHELLGQTGVILPQLDGYLAGRDAYLSGEFDKAVHIFSRVLEAHPHDGPSQLLLYRSRQLLNTPPRGRWTGVWAQH